VTSRKTSDAFVRLFATLLKMNPKSNPSLKPLNEISVLLLLYD